MYEALWNIVMLCTVMAVGGVVFVAIGMFIVSLLGFTDE